MGKKNKDGLESRVLKANGLIKRDEEGHYYLPMCNFRHHVGIIQDENVCFSRSCDNYVRYYLLHQDIEYSLMEEKYAEFHPEEAISDKPKDL